MKKSAIALPALAFVLSAAPALAQSAPRAMTAEDLITLKRVGAPTASPDGKWVIFQQTDTDREQVAAWIALVRALGGGWQAGDPPPAGPATGG